MRTKVKLAYDLKNAGAPDWMMRYAIDGRYDDYESELPMPIHQLVDDCNRMAKLKPYKGLKNISLKAMNGEYDGTKEESDAWMRKEGKYLLDEETLNALFGKE